MSWLRGQEWTEFSDGEDKLLKELLQRGLGVGLNTHVRIPLSVEVDGVEGTEVDFLWGPEAYAVYLDGEKVHSSRTSERRDDLVTVAMERRGYVVYRPRYDAPMSGGKCREIADAVQGKLEEMRVRR